MNRSDFLFFMAGALTFMAVETTGDHFRERRGPWDAVVNDQRVCAAAKQDTGSRIVLEGVLRGPCNSTDVGRKP